MTNISTKKEDLVIFGAGMVGLCLAYNLKKRYPDLSVSIFEKESYLGAHSSGRNSGVLHAGIYYEPNSLKARVCVKGRKRLIEWCNNEELEILNCGKFIVPQESRLDSNLESLQKRGFANGANSEIVNEEFFYKMVPDGFTSSGRALWVPSTCVLNPKKVLERLSLRLVESGVKINFGTKILSINPYLKEINLKTSESCKKITYGYLFNTTGLMSDKFASFYKLGKDFTILPFKGIYWKLSSNAPFKFKTNVYPVPDLNVPFLGVHITPDLEGNVYLGPTAIPAFGRENYSGLKNIEPFMSINFFKELANLWLINKNGFRNYSREQGLHGIKPFFLESARKLIPGLRNEHLIKSDKVGIRAQLYNLVKKELVNDFYIENEDNSTHVLNSISPGFTASFELADLIISKSKLSYK